MPDFQPDSFSPTTTHTNDVITTSLAETRNACWAIVTVIGANGVDCNTNSPRSCIQLKVAGMEDTLCTGLGDEESPVWNDSFTIFTDVLFELTLELHRSLPGNESLIAQVQGTVDMQACDGQEIIWQLKSIKDNMTIPVTFRVETREVVFDERVSSEDELTPFPNAFSLKDITLRLSPTEPHDFLSGCRLFVELVVEDTAFERTLPIAQDPNQGIWNCDGALSVPAGISFTLEIYAKGDGQDQDKSIASVTLTGEALLSAKTWNHEFTHTLDRNNVSSRNVEIAFTIVELNLDENKPCPQNSMPPNLSSKTRTRFIPSHIGPVPFDASPHSSDNACKSEKPYFDAEDLRRSCLENPESTRLDVFYETVIASPDDTPSKCDALGALGRLFFKRFTTFKGLPDLNKAITCHESAVALTPDKHPGQARLFAGWGIALLRRVKNGGSDIDTNNAIFALQTSVAQTPENDSELPERLMQLGDAFELRFSSCADIDDINQAIAAKDKASTLPSIDASDLGELFASIGHSLSLRYTRMRSLSDLERMAVCYQSAADLFPDSHADLKGMMYYLIGLALVQAFEQGGNVDHLQQAISALEMALPLLENKLDAKVRSLVVLARAFKLHFDRLGDILDLDQAISMQESAISRTLNPSAVSFDTLSELYHQKYHSTENAQHLDNALEAKKNATALMSPTDSRRSGRMATFAEIYLARFNKTGAISDLQIAMQHQQEAVAAMADGDPEKPMRLFDLGKMYRSRFMRLGNVNDIEQAISVLEQAACLAEKSDPANRWRALLALGAALKLSAKYTNQKDDELTGSQHEEQGRSLALRSFPELGDVFNPIKDIISALEDPTFQNLDSSFREVKQAVDSLGGVHPILHSQVWSTLALNACHSGDTDGLNHAIQQAEAAHEEIPDSHPDKVISLEVIAAAYHGRFKKLGILDDMDKAVAARRRAVALLSDDDPCKVESLFELASLLLTSPRARSNPVHGLESLLLLSLAAQSPVGWPASRLKSALKWARAAGLKRPFHAFPAFDQAIALLPRVAWRGLSVADRHRLIADAGTIVSEATACAIGCARYETAVEWMEQGRSIVWGQLLQLRSPISELEEREPALAARLQEVSRKMDTASSTQNESRDHRRLALDWDALLGKVRSLPGLESFMRPKSIAQLSNAARSGPVVVLTADSDQGSALVLMGGLDSILHISLPGLSRGTAEGLHGILSQLQSTTSIPRSRSDRGFAFPRKEKVNPEDEIKAMLCQLWDLVVQPIVESLALHCGSNADDLPHIWWCPTGPLAFLPIHAAGNYDSDEPGTKLLDYAVSSYTPTLTALLEKPEVKSDNEFKLLAVGQAATPGQDALPNTTKELDAIHARAGQLTVERLDGENATVERVLEGMKECGWVHLACHGTQNPDDPTKSALILADCDLELSTIINQNLPHAEFAFLSACQTATGDVKLQEEAVHFAAGMLLAGYRSVIATSWSILDRDGPFIADEVYRELFKDGRPDRSRAAWALHKAVQKLRLSGASFARWIPFIHLGE